MSRTANQFERRPMTALEQAQKIYAICVESARICPGVEPEIQSAGAGTHALLACFAG